MCRGGKDTDTFRRLGEFVQTSVSDSGCGIPEGTLVNIFDLFYTTKQVGERRSAWYIS